MATRTKFVMLWLGRDAKNILHIVPFPPGSALCGHAYEDRPCLRSEGTPTCMDCLTAESMESTNQ